MTDKCIDHLKFINCKCKNCGLDINEYGNTENQFQYCCFPDCGCESARNCMAEEGPSNISYALNRR